MLVIAVAVFVAVPVMIGVESIRNPFLGVWWFCLGGLESFAKVAAVVFEAILSALADATK